MQIAHDPTPLWQRFEAEFTSGNVYENPLQDADLLVTFIAPSGRHRMVRGFWDGGDTWRVRFAPDETGPWLLRTACSDETNTGLHAISGEFTCGAAEGETPFARHGPVRVSGNRRYLEHVDGTPFFWLADTAWNGPLRSTDEEWQHYLAVRSTQKFTAVHWMTTQWLTAPDGDREGQLAFTGHERIAVNPAMFQRLDSKLDAMNAAGLLGVTALLWAAEWSTPEVNGLNPGLVLPEEQCILLARYMVARWGGNAVAWFLPGDGNYVGEKAARWQRIGGAVFGAIDHAPVTLHPSGMQWYAAEFRNEAWLDFIGYQSGHFGSQQALAWIVQGPPAAGWQAEPPRPVINLEPNYEDHFDLHQSPRRFTPFDVRRACYWSLLIAPTAGVSYGGNGVWGWDDGTGVPTNHEIAGIARPWQEALHLPGAQQMTVLHDLFASLAWWKLWPAPELVVDQPGGAEPGRYVAAAATEDGRLVVYVPLERAVTLDLAGVGALQNAQWIDPRTGERLLAEAQPGEKGLDFVTPGEGDWLLLCELAPYPAEDRGFEYASLPAGRARNTSAAPAGREVTPGCRESPSWSGCGRRRRAIATILVSEGLQSCFPRSVQRGETR